MRSSTATVEPSRLSVGAYRHHETLKGHRDAKVRRLRMSQAIALKIAEGSGPRPPVKRRMAIDAGILKSQEAQRLRALRFKKSRKCARLCLQTTTISRRYCSIVLWRCRRRSDSLTTRPAWSLAKNGSVKSIRIPISIRSTTTAKPVRCVTYSSSVTDLHRCDPELAPRPLSV